MHNPSAYRFDVEGWVNFKYPLKIFIVSFRLGWLCVKAQ